MKRFTTDGCSGGLWKLLTGDVGPWNGCCVDHDKLYWPGGTRRGRAQADAALMACVANNGHPWIAVAMFIGVRVGGHPLLPTPWRWGYGHLWPRGYASTRQTPLAGASPIRRSWLYLAILIVILITATVVIWLSGMAEAQPQRMLIPKCAPPKVMHAKLLEGFKEEVDYKGIAYDPDGKLVGYMEVMTNRSERTFTLLLTHPSGSTTCMLLSGDQLGGKPEKDT